MKKVALVLSGCGYKNGAEITEAVSFLIALGSAGVATTCFAPADVMDEAAKIARDKIFDLKNLQQKDFDAVCFPGGFGAAKVLSDWASKGSKATILPDAKRVIQEFHAAGKPIGAACIAPTLVALSLGKFKPTITIGNDAETAAEIEKTGAHHEVCPVNDYVTDREHKVITTPAYMYDDALPNEVFEGISGLIKELVEMS